MLHLQLTSWFQTHLWEKLRSDVLKDTSCQLFYSTFFISLRFIASLRKSVLIISHLVSVNTTRYDGIFWTLLLVMYGLQWLPIFLLACVIISNPNYEEGPSVTTRMVLIVGLVISIVNYIPIITWALLIPSGLLQRYYVTNCCRGMRYWWICQLAWSNLYRGLFKSYLPFHIYTQWIQAKWEGTSVAIRGRVQPGCVGTILF